MKILMGNAEFSLLGIASGRATSLHLIDDRWVGHSFPWAECRVAVGYSFF